MSKTQFKEWRVKLIPFAIADIIQTRHHYMHKSVSSVSESYALVSPSDDIMGVIMFGTPNSVNASKPMFGKEKVKCAELKRMWLSDNVPHNGETYFLWSCIRMIGKQGGKLANTEAIITYADPEHHQGLIYRAANFTYCGAGPGNLEIEIDGQVCSSSILSGCKLSELKMVFKDSLRATKKPGKLRFCKVIAKGKRGKQLEAMLKEVK